MLGVLSIVAVHIGAPAQTMIAKMDENTAAVAEGTCLKLSEVQVKMAKL